MGPRYWGLTVTVPSSQLPLKQDAVAVGARKCFRESPDELGTDPVLPEVSVGADSRETPV